MSRRRRDFISIPSVVILMRKLWFEVAARTRANQREEKTSLEFDVIGKKTNTRFKPTLVVVHEDYTVSMILSQNRLTAVIRGTGPILSVFP